MERQPTLEDTQRLLWALISAPNGVSAALVADPEAARLRNAVEAQIAGDERLSAVDRLEIYANMYFFRLRDCLAEDFRAVHAVVGPTHFHNLITDYVLAYPSTHPSLRFAGRHLPPMLATHGLSDRWPFLADLARLEWAMLDAFDAADVRVLQESDLERVPAEEWPALRLSLVSSAQLLSLDWPVHEAWRCVDRDEPPITPARAPTTLLVWRRGFRVLHRTVSPIERVALDQVRAGAPFGALCERLAEAVGQDAAPIETLGLVRRWLAEELLAA
jgi:hypothetical protein